MTEMYLNQLDRRRSRTGCLAIAALVVVLVAVAVVVTIQRRGGDAVPGDDEGLPAMATQSAAPAAATRVVRGPATTITPATDQGARLLEQARAALGENRLGEARDLAWRVLDESQNASARAAAGDLLGEVHTTLVFSRHPMPEKEDYRVRPGDTLAVLARRFGTTVDLIRQSNGITGDVIRIDQHLRILNASFRLEISKSRNDLVVYMNDRFFKRYPVGTGEFATTPEGAFVIEERIPRPVWWKDGRQIPYGHEDNLLGTHYLKLDVPGYGIHGTWEPESIGHQSSAGCVRLLNEDIEELYTLLPVGVEVVIEE
jgi:LysM repeat protein